MSARLVSVNLAVVRTGAWTGDMGSTGIDKRPTTERVRAGRLGLVGDTIVDTRHHGGVDQAVYAYAREDAAWWARELGREAPPGRFGENLSTEGLDVTGAVIGERWEIGGALLEVSCPRIPCRVFAGFWDVPDLIKRFTARAWPGAYLRVLREGALGAGDAIGVVRRPAHGVTIGEAFRALTTEADLLPRLLEASELPSEAHETARRRQGVG
ncbi:MAG: MOSC domain-containing protein [Micromonosporaceae bacterium]|nr:MOSC domain-containing protein [Micromonosporaceae bacterium]